MNRKSSLLVLLLILAGLVYLALYLGVLPSALQVVLGVLVVAVLPGYLLTEIFFPFLKSTQRITLSLGLSMVFVILLGFVLHLAGFGLLRDMWLAVSFYSVIVILGFAALFRLSQREVEDTKPLYLPKLHEPFLLFVAVGISVAAVAMASDSSHQQKTPITQLWMLPQESSNTVQIGVVSNHMPTFRLELIGDGEKLLDELVVILNAKANVTELELDEAYKQLEATLYKPDSTVPYRRVVLW
jgi:hypothetical protein